MKTHIKFDPQLDDSYESIIQYSLHFPTLFHELTAASSAVASFSFSNPETLERNVLEYTTDKVWAL